MELKLKKPSILSDNRNRESNTPARAMYCRHGYHATDGSLVMLEKHLGEETAL